MELWLCGQYRSGEKIGEIIWDFQGVFSAKDKAIRACRNRNYFIAPIDVDKEIPDQIEEMPNVEYPLNDY
ncbi:MAG: hypothetical protein ABFD75_12325 [Smithella sp.]